MKTTTWNKVEIGTTIKVVSPITDITIEAEKISNYSVKHGGRTIKITTDADSLKFVRVCR